MAYKLIFTRSYIRELDSSAEYLREQLGSPAAARRMILNVIKELKRIKIDPYIYQKYDNRTPGGAEYRRVCIGN